MRLRKVLMVDDHAMVREGTRLLIEQQALGCELLEAGTWREARQRLTEHGDIDLVLLDLGLPDVAGLGALSELRRDRAELPVVVLSGNEERSVVLECINHGAMGFIGKSATAAVLVEALEVVFSGDIYLPTALLGKSHATAAPATTQRAGLSKLGLTPRQIDVIELMVQGLSNKAIAERLSLAEPTVKTHVAAGLRALNVRNRTQAVFALAEWGHLRPRRTAAHE
ncbi:MAG: response regulator transcription factor [Polyangiaceae bacterium]